MSDLKDFQNGCAYIINRCCVSGGQDLEFGFLRTKQSVSECSFEFELQRQKQASDYHEPELYGAYVTFWL